MRGFLVLLKPVEILNVPPLVWLGIFFFLLLVSLPLRIVEFIRTEYHFIAIFYYSLTSHKYVESTFVCVMNSELMTVQFEFTILTVVNEHCWFCHCSSYYTIFQVFHKENLGFLQDVDFGIVATHNFEWASFRKFSFYCYFLWFFVLYSRNGILLPLSADHLLLLQSLLNSEIPIPPWKFEFLLRLCLLPYLEYICIDLLKCLLVVLPIVTGQNVVDLKVVIFHFAVVFAQSNKGNFPFFERSNQVIHFCMIFGVPWVRALNYFWMKSMSSWGLFFFSSSSFFLSCCFSLSFSG